MKIQFETQRVLSEDLGNSRTKLRKWAKQSEIQFHGLGCCGCFEIVTQYYYSVGGAQLSAGVV